MEIQPRKLRLLEFKPHLVKVQDVMNDTKLEIPRRRFEKQLNMGIYEVVNPEALPTFF